MPPACCATRANDLLATIAVVATFFWANAALADVADAPRSVDRLVSELREASLELRKSRVKDEAGGDPTPDPESEVGDDAIASEAEPEPEPEDEAEPEPEVEVELDAEAEEVAEPVAERADTSDADASLDVASAAGADESAAHDDVAVAPAPAPSAPVFEAVVAGVPIRLTGIIHARIEVTQGVQSFDNATAVAPTSAVHPAVMANPDEVLLSFQVQQTRLGMTIGDPNNFRGIVEIDFTHFEQSTPTVQAYPRIRIGLLEWTFAPGHKLFLGQTWDIFGNATGPQLLSHSFNLVGSLFRAGNVGFMRQQLGWSGRFDAVELALAVGLQGANTGPTFNAIESSLTPTGAARLMIHVGDRQIIGLSAIATAFRYTRGAESEHRPAMGAVAFTDAQIGTFNLHAELYVAQNLAGSGALTLGAGRFGTNVVEIGGYLSGREQMNEHAVTMGFGMAGVLNPSAVAPGYVPANPMGTPPTTLASLAPPAGPGIVANLACFLGYWYSPLPGLSLVVEPYFYFTHFARDPSDIGRGLPEARAAVGARAGAMFQF